jgi:hypothetical protein
MGWMCIKEGLDILYGMIHEAMFSGKNLKQEDSVVY